MTDPVNQQSTAGLGAPFPQYHEPPPPPPTSTPPKRRIPPRRIGKFAPFARLNQRHIRTHGGRRHA